MANSKVTYWRWRVLRKAPTGRDSWRLLRWMMTEEEGAAWAAKEGKTLEKVPGSVVSQFEM